MGAYVPMAVVAKMIKIEPTRRPRLYSSIVEDAHWSSSEEAAAEESNWDGKEYND